MNLFELKGVRTSFVSTPEQLKIIGAVRYHSYLDAEAIDYNPSESLNDGYDYQPNIINHYASTEGEIIGSIRSCFYHPDRPDLNIPAKEVFYREINQEIGQQKSLVESCRFVVKPGINKRLLTNFSLIKTSIVAAWASKAEFIITACRKSHEKFYTRMGMIRISDPKVYPGLNIKMVLLMAPINREKENQINDTYGLLRFDESDKKRYCNNLIFLDLHSFNHIKSFYHASDPIQSMF